METLRGNWEHLSDQDRVSYTCGYCGVRTAGTFGYYQREGEGDIRICGGCNRPSFFDGDNQTPGPLVGRDIDILPVEIEILYSQARRCIQVESYTACVLVCRKILMHIAVEKNAPPNQQFIQYVEYLSDCGYIPPNGKDWVDEIRKKGNEANHEIVLVRKEDALELLSFVEMLLIFVFEFPGRKTSITTNK